ncbi:MAG TPA: peptide chain release factor N(5)-glutamine methyltransferase [Burkholderiales bacterium]|nr:peptide chain release factor N(5)-glutamine methyltransferase [Burkholderiales bacterium]
MSGIAGASALTVGQALAAEGIDRGEAACLLRAVTAANLAHLIAHPDARLTPNQTQRFLDLVRRRRKGEPIAYLAGRREFYGLDFEVTPAVLVPRPETELLVELALERIPDKAPTRVLDLGTGSGAVGVSIAALRPSAEVVAVDASEQALELARGNGVRLAGGARLTFLRSDWFSALQGRRFDLILSNPPYVAEGDPHLARGDLRFEPRQALVGGADGLAAIRSIVGEAPRHLFEGGWLLFEHGFDQATACRELLEGTGFMDLITAQDLAGIPRVAGGRWLTAGADDR